VVKKQTCGAMRRLIGALQEGIVASDEERGTMWQGIRIHATIYIV
jgi:hypothetical protein